VKRSSVVYVRVTPEVRKALDKVVKASGETMSSVVLRILSNALGIPDHIDEALHK
jgi:hypothetical protein